MRWKRVREEHPGQWVLVEALDACSLEGRRHLDELAVVEEFSGAEEAMRHYLDLHRRSPENELYVLHTDCETLEIEEREWLGLRPSPHQIRSTS
jgi:hypothetical protein